MRVSTGIRIDEVSPGITCVTYPDGYKKWVYGAWTLEDVINQEREQKFLENMLENNRQLYSMVSMPKGEHPKPQGNDADRSCGVRREFGELA